MTIPTTKTPNKPLGGFAGWLRVETIQGGKIGTLKVRPKADKSTLKTDCGWTVRMDRDLHITKPMDIGSRMTIALSDNCTFLYIEALTKYLS